MTDLQIILNKLKNNETILYTKFGDGEYYCMIGYNGKNCDGDTYNKWLSDKLIDSFKYLSDKSYIGKWHNAAELIVKYYDSLTNNDIKWIHYHSFLNATDVPEYNVYYNTFENDDFFNIIKFLKESNKNKLIVANKNNIKMKDILNSNFYEIPEKDWSYNYEEHKNNILSKIDNDSFLFISAGMCSKVLLADINRIYNKCSCIDFGSCFDFLCTKKNTRGWKHSYQIEFNYYKDLLPKNW